MLKRCSRLLPVAGFFAGLLLCGDALADGTSVFVTNNTPRKIEIRTRSTLPGRHWRVKKTTIPPFTRREIYETNRDGGVTNGKTFEFTSDVIVRNNKNRKILAQGPENFQLKLKLKGQIGGSHMWQSHRSQAGSTGAWEDDRNKHSTSLNVGGKRWSVNYWAYGTGGFDDVEYVFRENYPKPVGAGKRLPAAWKAHHLNVLSYNIFMRPILLDGQGKRTRMIPPQIKHYDVVVFQEVFDEALRPVLIQEMKKAGYPHVSKPLGKDEFIGALPVPIGGIPVGAPATIDDGGVIIFSRYPIVAQDQTNYSRCAGTDCLGKKGALWVKIKKRVAGKNYFFNVVGTHLDATSWNVRKSQLRELKAFVDRQSKIKKSDPLVFAGDFNVNMWMTEGGNNFDTSKDFDKMLDILEAGYFTGGQVRGHLRKNLTHDGPRNDLSDGARRYYDYVLWSKEHRGVMSSSFAEVRVPRAHHEYKITPTSTARWDLSDHYAVYASLHFEEEGLGLNFPPHEGPDEPVYLCNADTDCPGNLVCEKFPAGQGAPAGALPPPGAIVKATSRKPRVKSRSKVSQRRTFQRSTTRPSKASKKISRRKWSGTCRIAPPR